MALTWMLLWLSQAIALQLKRIGQGITLQIKYKKMSDISKCEGKDCQLKEQCYRYTAPANDFRQSYFVESPIKDGKCSHFWDNEEYKKVQKENKKD